MNPGGSERSGPRVLLCVTGGIAAYKIPELVRRLCKAGHEVEIVMTEAAERFVSPLTLATLSGRRVWRQGDFLSEEQGYRIPHVYLAEWADVIAVAPCTAESAANLAQGRAESLVCAALLASRAPVLLFPAMNAHMFEHPATQNNLKILSERGIKIINPGVGELACGESGRGRMPEPADIQEEILRALKLNKKQDLEGIPVLVTAGPTREYLDPVRYLSNPSTGRMGLAVARAAWRRGAEVRVVLGPLDAAPCPLYGLEVTRVTTALEMQDAVMQNLEWAKFIVKAAAVGDYRAKHPASRKVKREGRGEISLELVQNPDIAAEVGRKKRPGQVLIGFAAETDQLAENARSKLERKGLDYILANDVLAPGSGFASRTNTLHLISSEGELALLSGSKEEIADTFWEILAGRELRGLAR